MSPGHKTITAAGMTTDRITSLLELLHYRTVTPHQGYQFYCTAKQEQSGIFT